MLDLQYSLRAKEVGTRQITKARELREAMKRYVPTDAEFDEAFSSARVSRPHLARYYLRALEKTKKEQPQPEYIANDEVADVNLEHVMPLTPGKDWNVDEGTAQAAQKFLGNMVLIRAAENKNMGNSSFAQKKKVLAKSGYDLTKMVAACNAWDMEEIRNRQAHLAKLAVRTWPLDFAE